jgi:hypothetical protein
MKKISVFAILFLVSLAVVAQPVKELKKILELKIPSSREEGANAAAVAWHPVQKKYYAAMAGNPIHFIGVFDTKGKLLNPETQEALFDLRGLWYNSTTKTLQMNGYNDYGWAEYILDKKGFPSATKILHEEMNQPAEHSVGAFNPKENVVYFLNSEGSIDKYDYSTGKYTTFIELQLGNSDADDESDNYEVLEEYNSTSVVYTGIKGAELGLLNTANKEIELYNMESGLLTRKLSLPSGAPLPDFLNFAYCNGIYWLFDNQARIWMGYK